MKTRRAFEFLAAMGAAAALAHGQSVISARSGVIHLAEGDVYLSDKLIVPKFGEFPEVKPGNVVRSEDGRVEVLLTPGVFLRMGANSSFRMVRNKLEDTQVELVAGGILVECAELLEDNAVTFRYKEYTITPRKAGLFRVDAVPGGELRVYEGEVLVAANGSEVKVKRGKELALNGGLELAKFDPKVGDPLYRWSKRRAGNIALANLSAAKSLADSGRSWRTGGWYYNPYFGLMTYIPFGYINSPFGFGYYGPQTVHRVYAPPPRPVEMGMGSGGGMGMYNPHLGYNTVGRSVGPSVSAPSAGSGGGYPAAGSGGAQPAARSGDSGVGRGDSGGRGR
jgi:hypothetical protein